MYWINMPDYQEQNALDAHRDLPSYFWHGDTKMHCLADAIGQSLDYAYAPHIQRLMVTGNFCLLTDIAPSQVDEWYLGIYVDALEWVELPNTRGMSQFADGGLIATKPYVSSGAYIHKMSNYCESCHYNKNKKTEADACPFNSLYWNPGGNPSLTAEKSTNSEVSVDYTGAHWEVKTNVYSNYIKDQIRWVPGSDGIFEAQQIVDQVQWNRGVELPSTYKIKGVSIEAGFTRILSTVKEQSDKWQQTFVPLFQGNAGIGYAKSNWRDHYGLQVVSKRFTDTENKEYLPAYALHNAQVTWHNKALEFKLTARNLGGLSYTILPFRPNPPRNFQLDITYKLNKNNNK